MTMETSARPTTKEPPALGRLLLRRIGRFEPPSGTAHDLEAKDALLLAHLAIAGPTPRGRLAAMLWPDVDEERARGNLRQRLLRLKRATGVELVVGNALARLAQHISHDLDDAHELLEAVGADQAGEFAEWLDQERARRWSTPTRCSISTRCRRMRTGG
jgi:hypothetical protein